MSTPPDDLIPIQEAATLVGRSVSSLRGWVRSGQLKGYREDPTQPTSRLMVSREALHLLVMETKPVHPGGPRIEAPPDRTQEATRALQAERDALQALLEAERRTITVLESRCKDLQDMILTERERMKEWKDRATALEAERNALQEQSGLTWWKRLLIGGPVNKKTKSSTEEE